VGTGLLPTPAAFGSLLRFTFVFLVIDNIGFCPNLCTQAGVVAGIAGNLQCTPVYADSSCRISFNVDPARSRLPSSFSFNFNYLGSRAHGFYLLISATNWLGKDNIYQTTVEAEKREVFFGVEPSILNMELQPFLFEGFPGAPPEKVPTKAAGYLVLQGLFVNGSKAGPEAWQASAVMHQGGGCLVRLNFAVQNSLARYVTREKDTASGLFTQVASTVVCGVNVLIGLFRTLFEYLYLVYRKRQSRLIEEQRELKRQWLKKLQDARIAKVRGGMAVYFAYPLSLSLPLFLPLSLSLRLISCAYWVHTQVHMRMWWSGLGWGTGFVGLRASGWLVWNETGESGGGRRRRQSRFAGSEGHHQ
jgi:hypothetical protein